MTSLLYLDDSYLKEFTAKIISIKDSRFIELDQTAFYPAGGGQPSDIGELRTENGHRFNVIAVTKADGRVFHEVDRDGLKEGESVHGIINWERRYKLMRSHTAAHIVSSLIHQQTNAMITGNQLDTEKVRIDFNLDEFDQERLKEFISKANMIIQRDLVITTKTIPRAEAELHPSFSKLAKGLPEGIQNIRIVSIGDFDSQADGGTHVNSTKEIGKVEFLKAENKGKNNRRLYFVIKP